MKSFKEIGIHCKCHLRLWLEDELNAMPDATSIIVNLSHNGMGISMVDDRAQPGSIYWRHKFFTNVYEFLTSFGVGDGVSAFDGGIEIEICDMRGREI